MRKNLYHVSLTTLGWSGSTKFVVAVVCPTTAAAIAASLSFAPWDAHVHNITTELLGSVVYEEEGARLVSMSVEDIDTEIR